VLGGSHNLTAVEATSGEAIYCFQIEDAIGLENLVQQTLRKTQKHIELCLILILLFSLHLISSILLFLSRVRKDKIIYAF
jgi:hypothetical protein